MITNVLFKCGRVLLLNLVLLVLATHTQTYWTSSVIIVFHRTQSDIGQSRRVTIKSSTIFARLIVSPTANTALRFRTRFQVSIQAQYIVSLHCFSLYWLKIWSVYHMIWSISVVPVFVTNFGRKKLTNQTVSLIQYGPNLSQTWHALGKSLRQGLRSSHAVASFQPNSAHTEDKFCVAIHSAPSFSHWEHFVG